MRSSTGHTLTTDEAKKRCQKDTKVRYTDFSQHCISLARCQWKPWSMLILMPIRTSDTSKGLCILDDLLAPLPSSTTSRARALIVREQQQNHSPSMSLLRLALALFITLWCLNPTKNGSSTPLIYRRTLLVTAHDHRRTPKHEHH